MFVRKKKNKSGSTSVVVTRAMVNSRNWKQ